VICLWCDSRSPAPRYQAKPEEERGSVESSLRGLFEEVPGAVVKQERGTTGGSSPSPGPGAEDAPTGTVRGAPKIPLTKPDGSGGMLVNFEGIFRGRAPGGIAKPAFERHTKTGEHGSGGSWGRKGVGHVVFQCREVGAQAAYQFVAKPI
jgi:hypothetical protein